MTAGVGFDLQYVQEDVLFQLILGNMPTTYTDPTTGQPGGGFGTGLAVQTNLDDSVGLQNLERVAPTENNKFPAIGVQFDHYEERPYSNESHDFVAVFAVSLAVKNVASDTSADTVAAARALLRKYVDDGSGNGLSPILRTNVTLLGNCSWSIISGLREIAYDGQGASANALVQALYTFETHNLVRFR